MRQVLFWCLLLVLVRSAGAQTIPLVPRIGPNLLANANLNGTANWNPANGAVYDSTLSHTADGSGSVRLPSGSQLGSFQIAIDGSKTYIFSIYLRTASFSPGPGSVTIGWNVVDAGGGYIRQGGETLRGGNSGPGKWEEMSLVVTPTSDVTNIAIVVYRGYPDSGPGVDMWTDDLYVGEGVGFASPPTAKVPFTGTATTVDALGNFRIKKNGVFQDFFPFCIYGDTIRPNWVDYSVQGFTCNIWCGCEPNQLTTLERASQAVGGFNPDGLMCGIQVSQFAEPSRGQWDAGGVNLTNWINQCKATGKFESHGLLYHWDNEEFVYWNEEMTTASQIQTQDTIGGQRTHPRYILQGGYHTTRMMHNPSTGARGQDIAGTYIDGGGTGGNGHQGALNILQQNEGQDFPVVFYQVNNVTDGAPAGNLRYYLYRGLVNGARGMGIWRDCYQGGCDGNTAIPVHQVAWWPDVPNLRRELDQLLPLIKQPHWTTWTVAYNTGLPLDVGTRDYQNQGHLLMVNRSAAAVTTTFTIGGLPYTPLRVVDFFTGNTVTNFSGNSFTVTLPANGINSGSAVYRLEGTASTVPSITSALSVGATVGSPFTYQITATNSPTSYSASPLPAGLSVNTSTGVISGTPTTAGLVSTTIGATNATGTGTATLTITTTVAPLSPQLYVWWKFDEGTPATTTADFGTANAPGSLMTSPTWAPGRVGTSSLNFNGTDQYVLNANLSWPANQPVTVSLWVNTPGGVEAGAFKLGESDNRIGCHLPWKDNVVYCDYNLGSEVTTGRAQIDFTPYLNRWTHVVFTGTTTRRELYINGALVATSPNTVTALPALTGLEVARYAVAGQAVYHQPGLIDDFRLYTYVLQAADILQLYRSTAGVRHAHMPQ